MVEIPAAKTTLGDYTDIVLNNLQHEDTTLKTNM